MSCYPPTCRYQTFHPVLDLTSHGPCHVLFNISSYSRLRIPFTSRPRLRIPFPSRPRLCVLFPSRPRLCVLFPSRPRLCVPFPSRPRLCVLFPSRPRLCVLFPSRPWLCVLFPSRPRLCVLFPSRPRLYVLFPARPRLYVPFPFRPRLCVLFPSRPRLYVLFPSRPRLCVLFISLLRSHPQPGPVSVCVRDVSVPGTSKSPALCLPSVASCPVSWCVSGSFPTLKLCISNSSYPPSGIIKRLTAYCYAGGSWGGEHRSPPPARPCWLPMRCSPDEPTSSVRRSLALPKTANIAKRLVWDHWPAPSLQARITGCRLVSGPQ